MKLLLLVSHLVYVINAYSNTEEVSEGSISSMTVENHFVKLNLKQGLLMNQAIATYALSDPQDERCKKHTEAFKDSLRSLEPWAVQMFDSSSKVQSGVLMGNLVEYGGFNQCINIFKNTLVGSIRGKHCSFKIFPRTKLLKTILRYRHISDKRFEKVRHGVLDGVKLIWSVCVPDSCPASDILYHFNKSMMEITQGLDLEMRLVEENCVSSLTLPKINLEVYIILTFSSILALTIIVSTFIEWKNGEQCRQIVKIFSLITNWRRMVSKGVGHELDCLHGIRFMSVCYVMFGHRFMNGMLYPNMNSLDLLDWILKYSSTIVIGGTICVDSFFLVSGILVSYGFFKHVTATNKFNIMLFYLHRYMRITLPLIAALVTYACLIPYFGSGPLWYDTYAYLQKTCRYFWWSTLLHLQPYVNPKFLCMSQTWYLACEMCYYYFSPVILYPLWKWEKLGIINLVFIYGMSVMSNFYFAWINKYEGSMPLTNRLLQTDYFHQHYIIPHIRASPYIIGLAVGYAIFKTQGRKMKISLAANLAGWMVAVACMSSVVLGSHAFQEENHTYNRLESSLYLSLSRSSWVLGISWIIWVCVHGYGGIVNDILACQIFRILGRTGYGIFLFHLLLQYLGNAASKTTGYYSDFLLIYECCADLVIMIIFGMIFLLCVEYPCMGLEAAILTRSVRRNTKVEAT